MKANASITVNRSHEYLNTVRDFKVLVDGKKVGWISDGQTKTFNVPAGQHELKFELDWTSSGVETFNLDEGESKLFTVSGFRIARWIIPVAIVSMILAPILAGIFHAPMFHLLTLPIFLLLVYYLTFGRKKYLSITQSGV